MAQFDVWRATGLVAREIPFLLEVQSPRFAEFGRRLVVPLEALPSMAGREAPWLPRFVIEGRDVFLNPLLTQSVQRSALRDRVASLADDLSAARVLRAIDEVISRA